MFVCTNSTDLILIMQRAPKGSRIQRWDFFSCVFKTRFFFVFFRRTRSHNHVQNFSS